MTPEEILRKTFDKYRFAEYPYGETLDAVLEAMEEILKIAAEKAKTKKKEILYEGVRAGGSYYIDIVDKDSILNSLK